MADPLSVTGTAVGVVSLGLQQLKSALNMIRAAAQLHQAQNQASSNTVLTCLCSCLAEMKALQEKMQEVGPSQQSNVNGKIKEIMKKLEYPFQVSSIEELEKSLERIIGLLSLAIHSLELNSNLAVSTNVDALGNAIKSQTDVLSRIKLDADTNQKINASNATQLTTIETSVLPLRPMIQTLESVTKDRLDEFENQVNTNHSVTTTHLDEVNANLSVTTTRLDELKSLTEANLQMMTEFRNIFQDINDQPVLKSPEYIRRRLVGTLVSKPSLLRDVHKSYDSQQEGVQSTSNLQISEYLSTTSSQRALGTYRPCECRSWSSVEERVTRWHTLRFFSKEETASTHRPWCPRYAVGASQRKQTFGITYVGLQRLLSAAVSMSLCLHHGAGGTSISTMIRYQCVVDENQSPPFRMVNVCFEAMLNINMCYARRKNFNSTRLKEKIFMDVSSWINVAYAKQVASPRDVTIDGASLIDHAYNWFPINSKLLAARLVSALFDLGVVATSQDLLSQWLQPWTTHRRNHYLGPLLSVILQRSPDGQYQLHATTMDFAYHGDLIRPFREICAVVELDLDPICTALLHEDLDSLSQILMTGAKQCFRSDQYRLRKSLIELAARWPLLEIIIFPEFKGNWSPQARILEIEILLELRCPLNEHALRGVFRFGRQAACIMLQHLKKWRESLRDVVQKYQPIHPQEKPTVYGPAVLDHEAFWAVKKLQAIGLDPYEMFGLQRDDYRLGSSHHEPQSIFYIIQHSDFAQIAFDMGFQDVDVLSGGLTPLSKAFSELDNIDYCKWLIDHGADFTRELAWIIDERRYGLDTINFPRYLILHWMFRRIGQNIGRSIYMNYLSYTSRPLQDMDIWISSATKSLCVSHLTQSNLYDGCSCACLSNPQGCSPTVILLNNAYRAYLRGVLETDHIIEDLTSIIDILVGVTGQLSTSVESVIRCITFHQLGIRHTCCASIGTWLGRDMPAEYGSDFDELREEDEYRVHQLNELIPDFMDQYNHSGLSIRDFISGPWIDRIRRIKAEESMGWTTEEKDKLLAIGVLPKNGTGSTKPSREDEDDDESGYKIEWLQSEYWNKQFEIIANGGRSVEEPRD
ncbi:hypothetical protein F5Y12DRAFT_719582 [Xylaria sp. FL1777]|nr:hypothetical protein F5Y12DRAFT_719582 [Xylaria sp. FL1777]